jgi:hypothetical protein
MEQTIGRRARSRDEEAFQALYSALAGHAAVPRARVKTEVRNVPAAALNSASRSRLGKCPTPLIQTSSELLRRRCIRSASARDEAILVADNDRRRGIQFRDGSMSSGRSPRTAATAEAATSIRRRSSVAMRRRFSVRGRGQRRRHHIGWLSSCSRFPCDVARRRAGTVFQQCPMLGTSRLRRDVRKADAAVVKADIRAYPQMSRRPGIYRCAHCGHALSRCGPCSSLRRS